MEKQGKILNKQVIGICFGIVAAIVVLLSQSFYFDYLVSTEKITAEVADEGEDEPEILSISKIALTSAVQHSITHALHFIADIYFDNSGEERVEVDQKVNFNTYFNTLFRLIISPNAP